jgi:transposase InsO family protein
MIQKVHEEIPAISLEHLCDLFTVSRSWYYEQSAKPEEDEEETALRDRIEAILLEFAGYGYRRVAHTLHREGRQVNHKRVLRIMQEESLLCRIKKSFVIKTTNSRHRFPVYPNLLAGLELTAPDQAWVSDAHVYSTTRGICVSGLYSGCLFSPLYWLVPLT